MKALFLLIQTARFTKSPDLFNLVSEGDKMSLLFICRSPDNPATFDLLSENIAIPTFGHNVEEVKS